VKISNESLKENELGGHLVMKHNPFVGKECCLIERNNGISDSGWILQTAELFALCNQLH
jgi:hypothetical protein